MSRTAPRAAGLAGLGLLVLSACTGTPAAPPTPSIGTPVSTARATASAGPATGTPDASKPATWVSLAAGSTTQCEAGTGYAIHGAGDYWLTGDCDAVSLSADGSDVESAGPIAVLTVQGDNNDVDARAVAALKVSGDGNDLETDDVTNGSVSGQDNDLSLTSANALLVNGDHNSFEVETRIGLLTINGNDNEVEAQTIEKRDVVGDGIRITP